MDGLERKFGFDVLAKYIQFELTGGHKLLNHNDVF